MHRCFECGDFQHKREFQIVLAVKIPQRLQCGFTLIELMVTISIAAVLMMIAVPSLTTYRRNAELTSVTNTLVASINTARGEALKRGLSSMVVPINNGTVWATGWVVFVDTDSSRTYSNATDTLVYTAPAPEGYINITATGPASAAISQIIFDSSGYPRTAAGASGNFTFRVERNDSPDFSEKRFIVVARTGRTRVCKPISAADSACSSTSSE